MSIGNITGFNTENQTKPSGKRAETALFILIDMTGRGFPRPPPGKHL
jgi:hypothetical protein